jgi:hypothetical protein
MRSFEADKGRQIMGGSAVESLEARIRAARKLSLDGLKAIYDLTSGIDFSKPRQTAEAIAQVIWEDDVKSWWSWQAGEMVFNPARRVEIRLPREHHRKVAKAAEEFEEALKKGEFAPSVDPYLYAVTDHHADWFTIFFLGPLLAYLLQRAENRQRQRAELDRLFAEMAGYIIVTPT